MYNSEYQKEYQKEMFARSPATVALETTVTILIIGTALLGNLLVCFAVYRSKKLRTASNLYIVALAISDILMAVICMPLSAEVFATGKFPHGKHVAHLQGSFAFFLPIASLQLMTAMAVNRFYRIVRRELFLKYFSLQKTVLSLAIIMILAVLGPCLPLIFGFAKYDFHNGKVLSYLSYSSEIAAYFYTLFLKIFYIAVPALVTLVCYYRIFAKVRSHKKLIQHNNSSGRLAMNVEEITITKPLFAAVLGFLACWTPVAVIDMMDTFTHHSIYHPRQVFVFYLLMGYASSSINPFIYGFLNRSFKQEFVKIFRLIFPRCFNNNTNPSDSVGALSVRAFASRQNAGQKNPSSVVGLSIVS